MSRYTSHTSLPFAVTVLATALGCSNAANPPPAGRPGAMAADSGLVEVMNNGGVSGSGQNGGNDGGTTGAARDAASGPAPTRICVATTPATNNVSVSLANQPDARLDVRSVRVYWDPDSCDKPRIIVDLTDAACGAAPNHRVRFRFYAAAVSDGLIVPGGIPFANERVEVTYTRPASLAPAGTWQCVQDGLLTLTTPEVSVFSPLTGSFRAVLRGCLGEDPGEIATIEGQFDFVITQPLDEVCR